MAALRYDTIRLYNTIKFHSIQYNNRFDSIHSGCTFDGDDVDGEMVDDEDEDYPGVIAYDR